MPVVESSTLPAAVLLALCLSVKPVPVRSVLLSRITLSRDVGDEGFTQVLNMTLVWLLVRELPRVVYPDPL